MHHKQITTATTRHSRPETEKESEREKERERVHYCRCDSICLLTFLPVTRSRTVKFDFPNSSYFNESLLVAKFTFTLLFLFLHHLHPRRHHLSLSPSLSSTCHNWHEKQCISSNCNGNMNHGYCDCH